MNGWRKNNSDSLDTRDHTAHINDDGMSDDPFTVVIYGPVGVGKSSVVEWMSTTSSSTSSDATRIFGVREPTEAMIESGALDDVYKNRSSSGFRLQMLVLAERLSTYWQVAARLSRQPFAAENPHRPIVILADGHIELDQHIFIGEHVRHGRMSSNEHEMYHTAAAVLLAQAPVFMQRPHMYVYLRADPIVCARRAASRGRAEESMLSAHFFTTMCEACERLTKTLAAQNSTSVVTINTNNEPLEGVCQAVAAAVCAEIGVQRRL